MRQLASKKLESQSQFPLTSFVKVDLYCRWQLEGTNARQFQLLAEGLIRGRTLYLWGSQYRVIGCVRFSPGSMVAGVEFLGVDFQV